MSILAGAAVVLYRLFDVGYEIDLGHAATLLAPAGAGRSRPRRGDAAAIVMPRPPVRLELEGGVTASLYDFGVVSLRLQCGTPRDLSWESSSRRRLGIRPLPSCARRWTVPSPSCCSASGRR